MQVRHARSPRFAFLDITMPRDGGKQSQGGSDDQDADDDADDDDQDDQQDDQDDDESDGDEESKDGGSKKGKNGQAGKKKKADDSGSEIEELRRNQKRLERRIKTLSNFRQQASRKLGLRPPPADDSDLEDDDDADDDSDDRQSKGRKKAPQGKGRDGSGSPALRALERRVAESEKKRAIAEAMSGVDGVTSEARSMIRKLVEVAVYDVDGEYYADDDDGETYSLEEFAKKLAGSKSFRKATGKGGPDDDGARSKAREKSGSKKSFEDYSEEEIQNMSPKEFAALSRMGRR